MPNDLSGKPADLPGHFAQPQFTVAYGGGVNRSPLPTLLTMVGITAALYLGKDILLPIAIALLLTFALAPIVSFLRRRSVPKAVAVILAVGSAFAAIALISFIIATQVANLAQNIPTYQGNILEKVRSIRQMGESGGILDRLTGAIERVGQEFNGGSLANNNPAVTTTAPMPVEIVSKTSPIETLQNVIVPLISPFATAGLIVVVVIFMLLERENLRDRFIRLAGYGDLHRTTEALQDAGRRLGRYLLMQLVINTTYAIPIAAGLWLLGIPNAILWGVLSLVLRFVPYIGPAIAMLLPLLLSLAVDPGWSLLLWTGALFLVVELISNNILEPWLYGSRTGLSPLAIVVAAIFWTWLWGPLGLVLSTPLTVCLVVLGRYVPQFEFLDVLLGNEPVLEPHARLYQRLLAGDPDEATDHAEEYLEEEYLVDFYDQVAIPALLLGEQDRQRGVLTDEQRIQIANSAQILVSNLKEIAGEEEKEETSTSADTPASEDFDDMPDGRGKTLLCLGGRGEIDDAAAAMLAQVLEVHGAAASVAGHETLATGQIAQLPLGGLDTVIVAYLNDGSSAQARQTVRRIKRRRRDVRVGILMPQQRESRDISVEKADGLGADFLVTTVAEAVKVGLTETRPVPLKAPPKRLVRYRSAPKEKAEAVAG